MDEFAEMMTKADYIELLNTMVKNRGLTEHLGTRFDGRKIEYVKNEEKTKRLASFGSMSTCYDMETANMVIYDIVSKNVDAIAEWLTTKMPSFGIYAEYDRPIGYTLDAEGNRRDTNKVKVVFRKEIPGVTEYGFSISSVIPL